MQCWGAELPEAAKAVLRARLGLDQPLWHQYMDFLGGLLHGDLGEALINQSPCARSLAGHYPPASN